jgi:osmotically inducible lipoprotein OsmB
MKRLALAAALTLSVASLSACGHTTGDRALSGAGIGALGGLAVGSLVGDAGAGAVIGGLGGAAVGALTSPRDVNLGTPIWRR